MDKNYAFFMKTEVGAYIGEWIAIAEEKIVAHGKNAKQVYEEATVHYPHKRIFLARVPEKETMILNGFSDFVGPKGVLRSV